MTSMKTTICVAEDRTICEPSLKLLLVSLAKHCPGRTISVFYPPATDLRAHDTQDKTAKDVFVLLGAGEVDLHFDRGDGPGTFQPQDGRGGSLADRAVGPHREDHPLPGQVPAADVGLTHNVGGIGQYCFVNVYRRD